MDKLPKELNIQIFLWLEPEDFANIPLVCKKWLSLCSQSMWKQLFLKKFGTLWCTPCTQVFTWQRELVLRTRSLAAWNKTRLGHSVYLSPLSRITHASVDWDQRLMVAACVNDDSLLCTNLASGSLHSNTRRVWGRKFEVHPDIIATSKYGILTGTRNGEVAYAGVGHPFAKVMLTATPRPYRHITFLWLSPVSRPAGKSRVPTIAVGNEDGNLWLFGGPENLLFEHNFDDSVVVDLYPLDGHHLIVTKTGVYLLDKDFNITEINCKPPSKVWGAYPYAVVQQKRSIYRINLNDNITDTFCEKRDPTIVVADKTFICAYFEATNTISCWAIKDHADMGEVPPIWTQELPLQREFPYELNQEYPLVSMAMNSVVLVCALCNAEDDSFCVFNILNGERLKPKGGKLPKSTLEKARYWHGRPVQQTLDVSPSLKPAFAATLGKIVMVVGKVDPESAKSKVKKSRETVKRAQEMKIKMLQNDFEEDNDYTTRRINFENLSRVDGMSEQEQLTTAVAMSESHTPALNEREQMMIALQQSELENVGLSEQEQIRLALQQSLGEGDEPSGAAEEDIDEEKELQRILELSLHDK